MEGGGGDGGASGGRFPILQASRDPESNWEVDVAKSLEEYLLKICSGEVSGEDGTHSVNFAEAALLLQGSVQVYSRKVEYLYSLVLNCLEFLSHKKQDQQENGSAQANENDPSTTPKEEDDIFMGLDDVQVEARTTLDNNVDRDDLQRKIVRPPANLLVFEGDCLDSEASELDLYLLATCDFYGDFLLLDPCDAPAVFDFLQGKNSGKENSVAHQGSSVPSKSRANVFTSPNGRSGGTGRRSAPGKVQGDPDRTQENNPDQSQEMDANQTQENIRDFNVDDNHWSDPVDHGVPDDDTPHPDDADAGYPDVGDDSDDEDPWKPLNPHEPGNLKIRPYRRVKGFARQVIGTPKKKTLASLFPMAKMDGVIIPEHAKSFEAQQSQQEEPHASQPPPPYEKLLRLLEFGEQDNFHVFGDLNDNSGPNIGANDFDDIDDPYMPNDMYDMDVDTDIPTYPDKNNGATLDGAQGSQENMDAHESLDDLCRSHLNALLASIAEVEQQSEMDARVSTWKERIEHALEEQDKNPPFDICSYGEQILDTLSSRTDNTGIASFSEIVIGRPKYEVARTFSALLQLVNGRSVDLDKGHATNELVCYTADNSFHVRLIGPNRRPEMEASFARKRVKSPLQNCGKGNESSLSQKKSPKKQSHRNGKVPVKTAIRLTPDGKRRRRSAQLMQSINLESSG
ncbi:condensin-2 complex subunit H2-like [Phragmites australis]|uniref:condensin-2 complex subunit H2-like n=1 Tax=Phragmites australis TaxID=29695 RepID=UPI002D79BDEE|nr:condensin-2 complex subunit H2-like [Phragmites australis]